jgi:hypothetical protein
MEKHLKAWRIHRVLSWLYGLSLLALVAFIYFEQRPAAYANLFIPAAVLCALLLVFHVLVGRGALARRPWARIASILFGFVMLPAFPIGTWFGIRLIQASWSPWAVATTRGSPGAGGWPSDAPRDRARVNPNR